jgi:hypothetical protein
MPTTSLSLVVVILDHFPMILGRDASALDLPALSDAFLRHFLTSFGAAISSVLLLEGVLGEGTRARAMRQHSIAEEYPRS